MSTNFTMQYTFVRCMHIHGVDCCVRYSCLTCMQYVAIKNWDRLRERGGREGGRGEGERERERETERERERDRQTDRERERERESCAMTHANFSSICRGTFIDECNRETARKRHKDRKS